MQALRILAQVPFDAGSAPMRVAADKTRHVTADILEPLYGRLKALADAERRPVSWIVLAALREYVASRPPLAEAPPAGVRKPTADDLAGVEWWNALTERSRSYWMQVSKSTTPKHAWDYYKLIREIEGDVSR